MDSIQKNKGNYNYSKYREEKTLDQKNTCILIFTKLVEKKIIYLILKLLIIIIYNYRLYSSIFNFYCDISGAGNTPNEKWEK